jgi:hypothetical protein
MRSDDDDDDDESAIKKIRNAKAKSSLVNDKLNVLIANHEENTNLAR